MNFKLKLIKFLKDSGVKEAGLSASLDGMEGYLDITGEDENGKFSETLDDEFFSEHNL